jgi:hypothetical protein
VYEYDGYNTITSFSVPAVTRVEAIRTAREERTLARIKKESGGRGRTSGDIGREGQGQVQGQRLGRSLNQLGLPPLPEVVSWEVSASFVVKGIMKKALLALALLHESGLAHRSLCGEAFVLTADSQDKVEK